MPTRPLRAALGALALVVFVGSLRAADATFDSDGVKISYSVEGEGEPVVLIHGFGANRQMQWGVPGVIGALAKDFQVIALDNRGHGRSDKPHDPEKYGVEMVNDVVRLLDHLKIEKAHVVGYSMGGFITGKLIETHPQRVLSATIGGAGWSEPDDPNLEFLDELAESLDKEGDIGPLIVHLTPAGQPQPSPEQIKAINQMLAFTSDFKALAAVIRGTRGLAVPEESLKRNQTPTLALIGEIDPLKRGVDAMQERMANLEVVVIDDADHMNAFARPEFIDNLTRFLTEQSTAAPAAAAAN